jgi:hypothetical protein
MSIKDYAGALADLDLQQKRFDRYAESFYFRGLICFQLDKPDDARVNLEKAKQLLLAGGYHFSDIIVKCMTAFTRKILKGRLQVLKNNKKIRKLIGSAAKHQRLFALYYITL